MIRIIYSTALIVSFFMTGPLNAESQKYKIIEINMASSYGSYISKIDFKTRTIEYVNRDYCIDDVKKPCFVQNIVQLSYQNSNDQKIISERKSAEKYLPKIDWKEDQLISIIKTVRNSDTKAYVKIQNFQIQPTRSISVSYRKSIEHPPYLECRLTVENKDVRENISCGISYVIGLSKAEDQNIYALHRLSCGVSICNEGLIIIEMDS